MYELGRGEHPEIFRSVERGSFGKFLGSLTAEILMSRNPDGWTLVHHAAIYGCLDEILRFIRDDSKLLLVTDDDPRTLPQFFGKGGGFNPVHVAAMYGHLEQLMEFIEGDKSLLTVASQGRKFNTCHYAAQSGFLYQIRHEWLDYDLLTSRNSYNESVIYLFLLGLHFIRGKKHEGKAREYLKLLPLTNITACLNLASTKIPIHQKLDQKGEALRNTVMAEIDSLVQRPASGIDYFAI